MDENIMKLIDRLIAAERLNVIYEARIKRVADLVRDTEWESAINEYSTARSIDDVNITTAKIRKAIGMEPEVETVAEFKEKNRKLAEERERRKLTEQMEEEDD